MARRAAACGGRVKGAAKLLFKWTNLDFLLSRTFKLLSQIEANSANSWHSLQLAIYFTGGNCCYLLQVHKQT
jgi:hypothetical protein